MKPPMMGALFGKSGRGSSCFSSPSLIESDSSAVFGAAFSSGVESTSGAEVVRGDFTEAVFVAEGFLEVFPVVFAFGLSDEVGQSTIGALFISIPAAFADMGITGRAVGTAFFGALFVAGLTSSISLLEVVVASMVDELRLSRTQATLGAGSLAALLGLGPAAGAVLSRGSDVAALARRR